MQSLEGLATAPISCGTVADVALPLEREQIATFYSVYHTFQIAILVTSDELYALIALDWLSLVTATWRYDNRGR